VNFQVEVRIELGCITWHLRHHSLLNFHRSSSFVLYSLC